MPDDTTKARIAEIRERCAKATPGQWKLRGCKNHPGGKDGRGVDLSCRMVKTEAGEPLSDDDKIFMAAAREDVPYLLAALDAANKRADRAEKELREREPTEANHE